MFPKYWLSSLHKGLGDKTNGANPIKTLNTIQTNANPWIPVSLPIVTGGCLTLLNKQEVFFCFLWWHPMACIH